MGLKHEISERGGQGVNISRLTQLFANCLPRPAHFQLTSLRRYIKLACLILLMIVTEFQCNRRNFGPFLNPNDSVISHFVIVCLSMSGQKDNYKMWYHKIIRIQKRLKILCCQQRISLTWLSRLTIKLNGSKNRKQSILIVSDFW